MERLLGSVLQRSLHRTLSKYFENLDVSALRLSPFAGDVVLTNLEMRIEALRAMGLPLTIQRGFVRELRVRIPWLKLQSEPIEVLVDMVEVVASVGESNGASTADGGESSPSCSHMAGTSPVLFFSLLFERGGAVVARFVCGCLACLGENTCENCQSAGGCWLRLCAETEMAVSLRNPVCWRSRGVVGCRCR